MTVSDTDLAALAASSDIISLGVLADDVRRQRHALRTTFVRVATVSVAPGAPVECPESAGEVRIAGVAGSLSAAIERIGEVRAVARGVPLSAFSLADLESLAVAEGLSLRSVLEAIRAAGVELVAEAPIDRLQNPRESIEEVNIAGLRLARLTVHQLPSTDTIALLRSVAELQRRVAVIQAFAPLPRQLNPAVPTTGYEDVKHVALARIVVDNVPSIQVDWSLYGPKLAQVALTVGADDVDAVSPEDETSEGRRRAPLEEIRRNILAAGQEPVERNGRFDVVSR